MVSRLLCSSLKILLAALLLSGCSGKIGSVSEASRKSSNIKDPDPDSDTLNLNNPLLNSWAPRFEGQVFFVSPSGTGISTNASLPGSATATLEGVQDGSVIKFLPGNYGVLKADRPLQSGRIKLVSTIPAVGGINTELRTNASYETIAGIVREPKTNGATLAGLSIKNFSGIWIEGFFLPQDASGIEVVYSSSAWIVRNRIYNQRDSRTGILAAGMRGAGIFVALENWIWNKRRDANWGMDYGIRMHGNGQSLLIIEKNLVMGGFNQPVSIKEGALKGYVNNNVFVGGAGKDEQSPGSSRYIVLGQEPDRGVEDRTSRQIFIQGNTIKASGAAIVNANTHEVIIENNNFLDLTSPLLQYFSAGPCSGCDSLSAVGIGPKMTLFKNNYINNTASLQAWPRENKAEILKLENNRTPGGLNPILLHQSISGDPDVPAVSHPVLPSVVREPSSGFTKELTE